MKQLVLTWLFSVSIVLAIAQQNDTLEIQRNENGDVTYARFKNSESRKLKDGVAFLKQILKGTENDNFKLIKDDTDKFHAAVGVPFQRWMPPSGLLTNASISSINS